MTFCHFIHFKSINLYFLEHFYWFKVLSGNTNICVISALLSVDCLFPFNLRFYWFLVKQFLDCILDNLNIMLWDSRSYLNPMEIVCMFKGTSMQGWSQTFISNFMDSLSKDLPSPQFPWSFPLQSFSQKLGLYLPSSAYISCCWPCVQDQLKRGEKVSSDVCFALPVMAPPGGEEDSAPSSFKLLWTGPSYWGCHCRHHRIA